jgi:hypothetical protein
MFFAICYQHGLHFFYLYLTKHELHNMNTATVVTKLGYFNVSFFIIKCQCISFVLSFNHWGFGFYLRDECVPSDLKKDIIHSQEWKRNYHMHNLHSYESYFSANLKFVIFVPVFTRHIAWLPHDQGEATSHPGVRVRQGHRALGTKLRGKKWRPAHIWQEIRLSGELGCAILPLKLMLAKTL